MTLCPMSVPELSRSSHVCLGPEGGTTTGKWFIETRCAVFVTEPRPVCLGGSLARKLPHLSCRHVTEQFVRPNIVYEPESLLG